MRLPALFACGLLTAWLGGAPLQCAGDPDPSMRMEEEPGEALYGLAGRFRTQGDERAWQKTLEYIVERYPASRFAVRAKLDLEEAGISTEGIDDP